MFFGKLYLIYQILPKDLYFIPSTLNWAQNVLNIQSTQNKNILKNYGKLQLRVI